MDARPLPRDAASSAPHRVVIIGGGFAGLYAAKNLGKAGDLVDVTLIDRRNHHLFQPMLYQVATGALSPGEIAQPLRSILRRQANTTVLLGEAVDIDAGRREVQLSDGGPVPYDTLIVATGAHHAYFGHDDWAPYAPGLKTIDDATEMRRRILIAFEAAEREADPVQRRAWMTFVIIGGGPTGVELAGALGEIANDTLRQDFRSINPQDARIVLVEAMDRVLATFPPGRSASAQRQLERLRVVVRTKTKVVHVEDGLVRVETPTGGTDEIHARTVLWAAGVLASSFGRKVAVATGAETDRNGRVRVGPDLTVPGHPEVFVVGDAAVQPWKKRPRHPGSRPGRHPGRLVRGQGGPRPAAWPARQAVPIQQPRRRRRHRAAARRDGHPVDGAVRPAGRLHRLAAVAPDPHHLPDRVLEPDRGRHPLGVLVPDPRQVDPADHGRAAGAADRGAGADRARPVGPDVAQDAPVPAEEREPEAGRV